MKIKIHHLNAIRIWLYIITALMIYTTGSVMTSLTGNENTARLYLIILLLFCVPFVVWCLMAKRLAKHLIIMAICIVAYWFVNAIYYSGSINHMTLRFVLFFALFCMSHYLIYKQIDLYKILYEIIFWLTIFALILFAMTTFAGSSIPYSTIQYGGFTYRNYYGIYYVASVYYIDFLWFKIFRLQSLFWEPGVYAIFLDLALYYYIFRKENKKKWHLIVILVALVFTVSTTGIIIGMLLLSIHLIRTKAFHKFRSILTLPIGGLTLAGIAYVWLQKRAESNRTGMSYALRISDLQVGLKLLLQHPILGTGYNNTDIFTTTQGFNRGNSNGLITWFYTMGLVGIVIAFYPFVVNILGAKDKNIKFERILFLIVFMAINLTEPIQLSPIVLFFVAYQYALTKKSKKR